MMASVALVAVEESVAVMAVVDSELYLRLAGNKISAELIEASGGSPNQVAFFLPF